MNLISIAQLVLTAAYLFHIGVIPSISDSYRTIKDKRIYHAFFFISAVLIGMQAVYSRDEMDIPYLIAGFCFFGLSLAASFWNRSEGWLHSSFTLTAIGIGLVLTVWRVWPMWEFWSLSLVAIAAIGSLVIRKYLDNSTYWVEVLIYLVVFLPII